MNEAPNTVGLQIRNLSKTYPSQVALRGVCLDVAPGRVHALLGQNGSGKSTLIKVLAGYHHPDEGAQAWLNGQPFELGSAGAAHTAGMRFVHQDLGLVPAMDVIDNLALGRSYKGRRWLSNREEAATARDLLIPFGLDVDVRTLLRNLTPAERTVVAIARALRGGISNSSVLVLDEPTATLPESETQLLFEAVRRVCAQGTAVLYVTHRLGEVFTLADTVTILRDGRRVITEPVSETSHDDLITHIAGRPLTQIYPPPPTPESTVVLDANAISGGAVQGVTVAVRQGEILGVAGISGSGRDDLNQLLFGSVSMTSGEVAIGGHRYRQLTPGVAIAAGVAYLPADRRTLSAIPSLTVRENVTLPKLGKRSLGWLGSRSERRDVDEWLRRLQVKPADSDRPFATLSGGNQQKVVLARWLRCGSRVLLLDEPTQGIDVGGKRAIYDALGDAARGGAAVVMSSSDAEELAEVCDRVIVLRNGRITAALDGLGLRADAIVAETLREGEAA
jgi:ribose transport system ATP-binding protein